MKILNVETIEGHREEKMGTMKIYFFIEDSVYPEDRVAQERRLLPQVIKAANELLPHWNQIRADAKISYSRNAGCRCGCSPGFIVRDTCTRHHVYVEVAQEGYQTPDQVLAAAIEHQIASL